MQKLLTQVFFYSNLQTVLKALESSLDAMVRVSGYKYSGKKGYSVQSLQQKNGIFVELLWHKKDSLELSVNPFWQK